VSAIVGIYYPDGRPIEHADLDRMVATLAHRGPDGAGVWHAGSVGLGHRMLWTTPESLHEQLPFTNAAGDITITADARIDNRDELIAALRITDRRPEEISDSEIILAAYERWGESCPEKLVGDFAFAIWDGRKQALFCARDHFGVKPFYYYHCPGRAFIFATEIKAIVCLPEAPRRLNELMVAYYLLQTFEDQAITFYQNIVRLPPGHRMTVSRAGVRLAAYWSLDPSHELRLGSDEEYAEAFRELFFAAVSCRLRSAFPVGSMLSGGLDSSSVTCVARELLASTRTGRLHTFSAIFDDVPECDERRFINTVLSQGSLEPHYVHPDRISPLAGWDHVLWHTDEAVYAPNLFMSWEICRAAQSHGVRVMLDGAEGDSVVSHGTAYLTELVRAGRWAAFAVEADALHRRVGFSRWSLFRVFCLRLLFPASLRPFWRALRRRKTINRGFARRIALKERLHALEVADLTPPQTARDGHYDGLTSGVVAYALEAADKVGAAFSIELRHPFYDKRLAEFCLSLPPEQKLQSGWSRIVLRRAMVNILPADIQWRSDKANFSLNFGRGLLTFERALLEETAHNIPQCIEEYVNTPALRAAYDRFVSRGAVQDVRKLWDAATLALWLRRTGLAP
jgi:asparagine synthase (glutamine-hydrolysing)